MKQQLTLLSLLVISICSDTIVGQRCGRNESYKWCGKLCEPICKDGRPENTNCIAAECSPFTADCRCNPGYLRDQKTGRCIPREACNSCWGKETLVPCGRICEGTCSTPFGPNTCKTALCYESECGCDLSAGFVRDLKTDRCVHFTQCRHRPQ